MSTRPRNAERTRAAIVEAARHLFAEQGIDTASIRDIAAAAGVSHGLVRQYFGNRESMVAEIIKHEIDTIMSEPRAHDFDPEYMTRTLPEGMERFRPFARIIMRAALAGMAPEKMIDPAATNPAMALASAIAGMQAERQPSNAPVLDPRLVSAYINAALFGFSAMAPWLMASVGLQPEAYETRRDEIGAITLALIELAGGVAPKGRRPPAASLTKSRR